jgi:large subunit ribosomal protein L17
MRHKKQGRRLNRNASHRKAMFANMAVSLIEHGSIKTTIQKAKELRMFIEPLVTKAGKGNPDPTARLLFSKLRDKQAVTKLMTVLGPKYKERPGGYLSILKCGYRAGDNALMSLVSFVEEAAAQD